MPFTTRAPASSTSTACRTTWAPRAARSSARDCRPCWATGSSSGSELRGRSMSRRGRHAFAVSLAALTLTGCFSFGAEKGSPRGTYRERLGGFAGLLRMEDRRAYDPLLAGRAAVSPDPWLRAKTALAVGRLRDPAAALYLPVLLEDPDAGVRRAAAFGAGISGDARLVRFLAAALGDSDSETAANAAEALGKIGGEEAPEAPVAGLAPGGGAGRSRPSCPRSEKSLLLPSSGERSSTPCRASRSWRRRPRCTRCLEGGMTIRPSFPGRPARRDYSRTKRALVTSCASRRIGTCPFRSRPWVRCTHFLKKARSPGATS